MRAPQVGALAAIAAGVWLALVAVIGLPAPDALEMPVSMTVRPQFLIARGDVRVQIRVPRDVDNRALVLTWAADSGGAGESRWPVEGDDGAVLYVRELPDQVPGHYVFIASLYGQRGELRGRASAEIHDSADGR